MAMKEGASKRSKIRALRSFQISQHMRMIRDLIPFCETPVVLASAVHHVWSDSAGSQLAGSSGGAASQLASSVQICLVNLHSKNRWFPVSRSLRHSEHSRLWGRYIMLSFMYPALIWNDHQLTLLISLFMSIYLVWKNLSKVPSYVFSIGFDKSDTHIPGSNSGKIVTKSELWNNGVPYPQCCSYLQEMHWTK